ncbi:MAG: hypothetical protein R3B90_14895 [Planctomycetaceae bacterium]
MLSPLERFRALVKSDDRAALVELKADPQPEHISAFLELGALRPQYCWQEHARTLAEIGGPAIDPLRNAIETGSEAEVEYALDLLKSSGLAGLPVVVGALQTTYPEFTRGEAAKATWSICRELKADAISVLHSLIPLIDDGNSTVRYWVTAAIGEIGPSAVDAIPKLLAIVGSQPLDECSHEAKALVKLGLPERPVVSGLPQATATVGGATGGPGRRPRIDRDHRLRPGLSASAWQVPRLETCLGLSRPVPGDRSSVRRGDRRGLSEHRPLGTPEDSRRLRDDDP